MFTAVLNRRAITCDTETGQDETIHLSGSLRSWMLAKASNVIHQSEMVSSSILEQTKGLQRHQGGIHLEIIHLREKPV